MERPPTRIPVALRFRGIRVDRHRLRLVAERCLETEGINPPFGLGIVLVGDRLVRRLNRDHRGIDSTTDVLSFSYGLPGDMALDAHGRTGGGHPGPGPGLPPELAEDDLPLIGEVVISVPRCRAQAGDHGVTAGRELVRLLVHGALHLLGYDHERATEAARMRPREVRLRTWAYRRKLDRGLLLAPRRRSRTR